MKFLADMGISQTVVKTLRDNGSDTLHQKSLSLTVLSFEFSIAAHNSSNGL